jgi:hypothetical protein
MTSQDINSIEDLKEILSNQERRIHELEMANAALIAEVKKRFVSKTELPTVIDESIPDSGLFSHSFVRRAFSVWGYHFIAQLLINIVLVVFYIIVFVLLLKKSIFPSFLW